MKIITIGRQFGSGGRELGKRIAEKLGFAYYDKEIIKAIAEHSGVAEEYVNSVVEKKNIDYYPITYAQSFSCINPLVELQSKIFSAQQDIIHDIAKKSDCVIVGRCADYILREQRPLTLFVYADMASKIERCRAKESRNQDFTDRQLTKRIKQIDRSRARYYADYTGAKWGDISNYRMCINTTGVEIKHIVPTVCAFAQLWFD